MMSFLELGASLYVPATRPDLAAVGSGVKRPAARSVIFCTEDAIGPREVSSALRNLQAALSHFDSAGPLRFVRVRSVDVLKALLDMNGRENLAGIVIPKATRRNLDAYLQCLQPDDPWQVMLTLETAEVFDSIEMTSLRTVLQQAPWRRRILSLRFGGNDLLQLLGLRRSRNRTIYASPLGQVIHQLVTTFRPHGFNITGPVYEFLDGRTVLARETRRDLASGLFGKSAIHPDQLAVIEAQYRVHARDLEAAERILDDAAAPVFRFDDAMCEPATHRAWAMLIAERARLYGVRAGSPRPILLPSNPHIQ